MDIHAAATLALTRDSADGLEVLLLQRTWDAVFMPGFYVFPGGRLDARDIDCIRHLAGHDDTSASALLDLSEGGATFMIGAIRECFEEAGVLLALDHQGQMVSDQHPAIHGEREAMIRGEQTLAGVCERYNLTLPLDRMAYLSHWITPPGMPRRFDTRFFVAAAPANQTPGHDGAETIDHLWLSPRKALDDHRLGLRLLGSPTLRTLRVLSDFETTDALLAYAHANPPEAASSEPWPARKDNRQVLIEAGAPAYDEVSKLDPERTGRACASITPGTPVTLAPGVQRLTAPNAGLMTGPGTNTYLLGAGDNFTVIDPGPADDRHIQQILTLTGGHIRQILVTHTHHDHSPGASALVRATGALRMGMPAPDQPTQDRDFRPDHTLSDGETLATGAGPLTAIHTPGHASNHLCYLLRDQGMLFSGDHIMQGSTVVINPPDGDMKAYLASLQRLLREDILYIAPGHGFLMGQVHAIIDYLTTHRLAREHKVIAAVKHHGPCKLDELTPYAYDDVPAAIHGVASRSLLAHLLKLQVEDRVRESGGIWHYHNPAP